MNRIAFRCWLLAATVLAGAAPARADFKLCNNTSSRIGVAIGYKDDKTWVSEGWWNVGSQTCEVLLKGPLVARFYYVHALDYDRGGQWGGKATMCTADKVFTIRGEADCTERGFKRSKFFEVDTNEEKDWTVKLTDPGEGGTATQ
jgi:uncharacterized membrane protein